MDLDSLGNASTKDYSYKVSIGDNRLVTGDAVYKAVMYGKPLKGTLTIPQQIADVTRGKESVSWNSGTYWELWNDNHPLEDPVDTTTVDGVTFNLSHVFIDSDVLGGMRSGIFNSSFYRAEFSNDRRVTYSGTGSGRINIDLQVMLAKRKDDERLSIFYCKSKQQPRMEIVIKQGVIVSQEIYYPRFYMDSYFVDSPLKLYGMSTPRITSLV